MSSLKKDKKRKISRKAKAIKPKSKIEQTLTKLAAVFALLGLVFALVLLYLGSPAAGEDPVTLSIPAQSTTGQIATQLEENNLIHSATYFKFYTKIMGADRSLKPGTYTFEGTENLSQIIDKLKEGSTDLISFTVPEGLNWEQTVNLLDSQGIATMEELLAAVEDPGLKFKYLEYLPEGPNRFEGFLFPDTYTIDAATGPVEIVQLMLDRFTEVYEGEYESRAEELDMDILQVITLASIVEREARVAQDRPLVSAVFHNRLAKNMRLQSCATVQYALGEVKPVLYNEDLQIDSPYNTYRNLGLPPGPISAPGEASLKAALYPADVSYLYFVAKADGSHVFNDTFQEHTEAKNKHLP